MTRRPGFKRAKETPRRGLASGLGAVATMALSTATAVGASQQNHPVVGAVFEASRWPTVVAATALAATAQTWAPTPTRRLVQAACLLTAGVQVGAYAYQEVTRARSAGRVAQGAHKLTVVTTNLTLNAEDPWKTLTRLSQSDADVLALQEVSQDWARVLSQWEVERYPYRRVAARADSCGFAILSRHPLGPARVLRGEDQRPMAQISTLYLPGQPVSLANVRLKSPSHTLQPQQSRYQALLVNAELRRRQWAELRDHLQHAHSDVPHVLMGDFNTTPYEPLIRHIKRDYVDTWNAVNWLPGPTRPSLPGLSAELPVPVARVDYVFSSPRLHVLYADRLPQLSGDHSAVRATLAV